MASLISICPKCGTNNEVVNTLYLRLDEETSVVCEKCALRFCATLSSEDVEALFEDSSTTPIVSGEEDYILKAEYYPTISDV